MPEKGKSDRVARKISSIGDLESRFVFIEDDTLRLNVTIAIQYIIFLITILDESEAQESTISSSIHKDMIVYTASIVEGCLHYSVKKYVAAGIIDTSRLFSTEWDLKDVKILWDVSETKRVIGATQIRSQNQLKNNTKFIVINRMALKSGILTRNLWEKSEQLRITRNAIHLKGLRSVDDRYTKKDAEKAFKSARDLIERLESKLKGLDIKNDL